jgi:hypothetical protein
MGRWLNSLRDEEKKFEKHSEVHPQNPQNLPDECFEGFEGVVTGVFAKKNPSGEPSSAPADARASVDKLLAEMGAENERRRGWFKESPHDPDGNLTIRSIITGEKTTIRIQRRRT